MTGNDNYTTVERNSTWASTTSGTTYSSRIRVRIPCNTYCSVVQRPIPSIVYIPSECELRLSKGLLPYLERIFQRNLWLLGLYIHNKPNDKPQIFNRKILKCNRYG